MGNNAGNAGFAGNADNAGNAGTTKVILCGFVLRLLVFALL
jgi:hypothetical protein